MIKNLHFTRSFTRILATVALAIFMFLPGTGWAQFSIDAGSTNYTQDFNTLTSGTWTNGTTLTGWYAKTDATASITTYAANTGTTTTAGLYAFGVAGTNPLTDRAIGYAPSNAYFGAAGTGKGYIGWRLKNNTGSPITSVSVTWTGEQWRKENNASSHTLNLFYQTGVTVTNLTNGTWTTASSTFTSPIVGATTATAIDGNVSANRVANITATITVTIAAGEEIMLRWEDLNDSGNDHYMAIDDVTINATVAGGSTPTITVTGTFNPFTSTVGTPSASQSVAVSGSNLTSTIEVAALTGYEYSTNDAAPWTSSLSLASSFSGSVYVRLTGASVGLFSGNVSFSSTGATQVDKAVTGSVNPITPVINVIGSFNAFSTIVGTPSASQSVAVTGSNLTSTIEISAVAEFEYSTTDAAPWATTLSLASSFNGNVYVRLTGASIGSPNGTISFTSTGATQVDKAVSGSVTAPTPVISVTGTFSAFSTTVGTPSASQSVAVSGANLTDVIAVSALAGYEYSTTDADPWTSDLSLASSFNGNVYVRLTGANGGTFNGTISFTSTGATQVDKTLSGTVLAPLPTLPLYENFDYTVGSLLTVNGWTAHSGAGTQAIDVTDGLTFPGYAGSGIGGAANLDNNGEDVHKTFTPQTSGTIYTAFIIKTEATNSAGYFLHLAQSTIGTTYFTRVWVNANGNGVGIGSNAPSSYVAITAGTPVLLVTKFDIATKVSSLFVLNTYSSTEPATADQTFTETVTPTDVGSIALRQYNASQKIIVDGLSIGNTWASVTPAAPPSITNFTPTNGCATGGTSVVITGTNFTGATAVTFNGINAASFTVDNAGQITATTPAGVSTGKIRITTPGGLIESTGNFTVNPILTPTFTQLGPYTVGATPDALPATSTNGITGTWVPATINTTAAGTITYTFTPEMGECATTVTMEITVNNPAGPKETTEAGDWNSITWSPAGAPTAIDNVIINHAVTLSGNADCKDLTIGTGSLTLASGASLFNRGASSGAITVNRLITANQWHFISPPVSGITAGKFSDMFLQSWSEPAAEWSYITNENTPLATTTGYSLYNDDATTTYSFTGPLNTVYSVDITQSGTSLVENDGANLVGNPFTSYLDWNGLYGTYGAIYYWDGIGYQSWINGGGGSRYAAPVQGFFIVKTDDVSATQFTVSNANRTNTAGTWYKSANELRPNTLVLETSGNNYTDKLFVEFNNEAAEAYDLVHDAFKFVSTTEGISQLYSYTGDKKLSIDVRPSCDMIQLGFTNTLSGEYQIGISEMNGISKATLEDTKTSTFHNLLNGPYSFSYTAGDDDKRFKIRMGTVGIENPTAESCNIYSYDKTAVIDLPAQTKGNIYIYNLAGQLIKSEESATGKVSIGLGSTGVYMVKVVTNMETLTKKVWIR